MNILLELIRSLKTYILVLDSYYSIMFFSFFIFLVACMYFTSAKEEVNYLKIKDNYLIL